MDFCFPQFSHFPHFNLFSTNDLIYSWNHYDLSFFFVGRFRLISFDFITILCVSERKSVEKKKQFCKIWEFYECEYDAESAIINENEEFPFDIEAKIYVQLFGCSCCSGYLSKYLPFYARFVCFATEIMCHISEYFECGKLLRHKIILKAFR